MGDLNLNPLDLPQKSTIHALFNAKFIDAKTYSSPHYRLYSHKKEKFFAVQNRDNQNDGHRKTIGSKLLTQGHKTILVNFIN